MEAKFKEKDKIVYGHDWDMRGKVDFVHDLGKGEYKYSITLDEQLETGKTSDIKAGLQPLANWKRLSPSQKKENVDGKYLKAA